VFWGDDKKLINFFEEKSASLGENPGYAYEFAPGKNPAGAHEGGKVKGKGKRGEKKLERGGEGENLRPHFFGPKWRQCPRKKET